MANVSSAAAAVLRRLEGKVALITGGASGIGEATAKLFSKHGAKVVIADIQDDLGNSVCKDLTEPGSYVHCDVTKENDVENAVNTAVSNYGKLDIMFNNAGITGVTKASILENTKSEFEEVINVNLVGMFLGTKHAARVMIPACRGSIINTSSVCGNMGGVASHGYTSSKHAAVGLMRNTAIELGPYGIRVNCVSPYVVETKMVRDFFKLKEDEVIDFYSNLKGANIVPQDVAEAVLYLGSDESKCVSGHNLIIDGGFSVHNDGLCTIGSSLRK